MADAYTYDVFISYKRSPAQPGRSNQQRGSIGNWVHDCFYGPFCAFLEGELGYVPEVFIDELDIAPGDIWPDRLKQSLACSRCLVPVLSPSYFASSWCVAEYNMMAKRETRLGIPLAGTSHGLILPVTVSDGDGFPPLVRARQAFDCRDFLSTAPTTFKNTSDFIVFEQQMRDWLRMVAPIIQQVPAWSHDHLADGDQLDGPIETVHRSTRSGMNRLPGIR
jgi:hypothetical protein